ncbi:aminoglycoside phosphotransferase family protein, partial [Patescibacteria group bacterium]|nr:aminoglycoside phosphotransferase family protein [Patescibacteria group bacterium]
FSAQSHLVKISIYIKGRAKPLVIRGNNWPESAYRIAETLNHQAKLSSPVPIYYHRPSKLILYPEVKGTPLRYLPLNLIVLSPLMVPLGKQLALFHKTRPPAELPKPSLINEKKRWKNNVQIITRASLKFSKPAKIILDRLSNILPKYWLDKNFSLIHGDYQASNLLIHGKNQVGLIDFTLSRRYFPASDLGIFLVHWQAMIRGHLTNIHREKLGHNFLKAYLANAPKTHQRTTMELLPLAIAEATLDVAAISLQIYGGKDKNVDQLLTELFASLNI